MTIDSAGNCYVADSANNVIRKITPAGIVSTLAGTPGIIGSKDGTGGAAQFNSPVGITVDGAGNLYVAESTNSTIRLITPAGVVTTWAGSALNVGSTDGPRLSARFTYPAALAIDGTINLYVADTGNFTIRKINAAGVVSTLAGSAGDPGASNGPGKAARFFQSLGLAVDRTGNIYVGDTGNQIVRKITPAGLVTTLAGTAGVNVAYMDATGPAAAFEAPQGVAVDAAGNVFVADAGTNCAIRKITPSGVVTTLGGLANFQDSIDGTGSAARFRQPFGIAVDNAGQEVYVADASANTIRVGVPAFPPALNTQPATATVPYGQIVTLTVAASSALPLTYQWTKNGAAITGATTATLSLEQSDGPRRRQLHRDGDQPRWSLDQHHGNADRRTCAHPNPAGQRGDSHRRKHGVLRPSGCACDSRLPMVRQNERTADPRRHEFDSGF